MVEALFRVEAGPLPWYLLSWSIMTVPVLLFASYADAFGARRIDVPVTAPCAVTDVVAAMRQLPGGDRLPASPLVAVNRSWVQDDAVIQPNDEIAVIPPVAGG
jgi:molybdopterin converting factor small subunit